MRFDPRVGKIPGGGHVYPLQYSCLENPMDRGAWQATVIGPQRVRHDSRDLARTQCMGLCEDEKNRYLWHAYQSDGHRAPVLHVYL